MSRRRRSERVFPIVALAAVALLAVIVLPSVLRPPPDQANASAALSPDAPKKDNPDAIISSFQQAGSATAGATKASDNGTASATTTTVPPPQLQPGRGQCFGDPPKQTESVYAPPCVPAFKGDNGGATYKNVTRDEARIALWHVLGMPSARGPIPTSFDSSTGSTMRTWIVLQQYYNKRYETYGRFIHLVATADPSDANNPDTERATAQQDDEQWQVLMADHLNYPFCDEFTRRKLICYNANPFPQKVYDERAPYWFGYEMNGDENDRLSAEYTCKRLVGPGATPYSATYAGTNDATDMTPMPRKIGVVYITNNNLRSASGFQNAMKAECGKQAFITYDIGGESQTVASEVAQAIADMKTKNVTTIIFATDLVTAIELMSTADQSQYYPEWVNFGNLGVDFNIIGATLPPNESKHLFGMSGWELPRPNNQTECWQAYRSIDPNNDPDGTVCTVFFFELEQMFSAIQLAGPNLNAKTLHDGFFQYGREFHPQQWASQGGYGPGDESFIDKMGEIWWSATTPDPAQGQPGAYIWTNHAKRYGLGEVPSGPPTELFKSGISRPES